MNFVLELISLLISGLLTFYFCKKFVFPWIGKSKFIRALDSKLADKLNRGKK